MSKTNKKSFTLIELVMIIILVLILAGISLRPLRKFYELWQFSTHRMQVLWGSRFAIEDMAINIRMIKDEDSIYVASPSNFEFDIEDENNNTIRIDYEFLDDNLYKDGFVFMDDVSSGGFSYYDEDGNPTAALEDIKSVEIDLTLTSGDETLSSQITINCRNLN